MKNQSSRRSVLKQLAAGSLAAATLPTLQAFCTSTTTMEDQQLKGNINHSVCQWTYNNLSLEQLCVEVKKIRFKGY